MALRRNNDFHRTVKAVEYSSFSHGGVGGSPQTNTDVIVPATGKKIYVTGWSITMIGSAAACSGDLYLTDGDKTSTNQILSATHVGVTPVVHSINFGEHPVALTTDTSLKISSTEADGHMVAYGTVYYIEV
jgi:hypothetical protein|tara:strand:- start:4058 stop:4450 length:393 start_codon:yes stop_codon:yes gene_type:complete